MCVLFTGGGMEMIGCYDVGDEREGDINCGGLKRNWSWWCRVMVKEDVCEKGGRSKNGM